MNLNGKLEKKNGKFYNDQSKSDQIHDKEIKLTNI